MAEAEPLYRRLLGPRFDALPEVLRTFHDTPGGGRGRGIFRVVRGTGLIRETLATIMGLPRTGEEVPVELRVVVEGPRARRIRDFEGRKVETVQWADGEILMERVGPTSFSSALVIEGATVRYEFLRAWFLGIRLPRRLSPRVDGLVSADEGGWRVSVRIIAPLLGQIIEYGGWVEALMSASRRLVTVVGGYGIFGGRIAESLARDSRCRVRIVGRNPKVGRNHAERLGAEFRTSSLGDADALRPALEGSFLVIHAAGPFQGSDYRVASLCLELGAHYLDLADARSFVAGIGALDDEARRRGLLVASGVSSTPAITSAMIAELCPEFSRIDEIDTALSPGNQNPRGASTIAAVLSYLGRSIRVWRDGRWVERPGWGDVRRLDFPPPVGRRRVHNCDVPELELFPSAFNAQTVRFAAGLELDLLNVLLSACAWPCRWFGVDLSRHARFFLNASLMLFPFGTTHGALAIRVRGLDPRGEPIERRIAIVTDYDGPATPSSAAVVLARKVLDGGPPRTGAFPCVGLLKLGEILEHLEPLGVWCARGDGSGWGTGPSRS